MGLSVSEFWALTPRELALTFDAVGWRQEQEWQWDVMLAWHTAAFVRAKKLPELKTLLASSAATVLTPEEKVRRQAEFERLNARMGVNRGGRK